MSFSFKKLLGFSGSTAEIVNGYLILSLPEASSPVVWRMALDKIETAAFEVKQKDGSEETQLILKPKKGTAEIIASFDSKREAVSALITASKAFQKAPLQNMAIIAPSTPKKENGTTVEAAITTTPTQIQTSTKKDETQKWLIAILGAFLVIGLYYYLTSLIPTTNVGFGGQNTATIATPSNPAKSTGVPISADDFLNGL